MNRIELINRVFQKGHLLKMTKPWYKKSVFSFFDWLMESDRVENDLTSKIISGKQIKAVISSKQDCVIAGIEEVGAYLNKFNNITFKVTTEDGKNIRAGKEVAIISGDSRMILSLERTILNIIQRMSGIATTTARFAELLEPVYIAATRKTPWMLLDKKAVAAGGGLTHRLDLSDGVLIKDNHLQIIKNEFNLSTEAEAVEHVIKLVSKNDEESSIEIEVNTREGADIVLQGFVRMPESINGVVMLDNWEPENVKNYIKAIRSKKKYNNILFEASGNINEGNLKDWSQTGVDVISSGSLTHSVKAVDLSLEVI